MPPDNLSELLEVWECEICGQLNRCDAAVLPDVCQKCKQRKTAGVRYKAVTAREYIKQHFFWGPLQGE
jgi:ribosome-binding protein aMBF1 (putative translation factor)